MATGRVFLCSTCAHAVEAWDEGNPYYLDEQGAKHYAHHPSPDRARCTGVESPVLCLSCGADSVRDSAAARPRCPDCDSRKLVDVWKLEGRTCPFCRRGTFAADPDSSMIS